MTLKPDLICGCSTTTVPSFALHSTRSMRRCGCQHAQITEIAAAWTVCRADSATRFLQRHCDIAAEVAAHVRAAAEGYGALRDKLWQLVDGKAATAIAIDDRRPGERSAWLAAAHTVTAGSGDPPAEEMVRQQVVAHM